MADPEAGPTATPVPCGTVIRQIRADDKPLLGAAFHRLGENSRYRRLLSPSPKLSESELRYLTKVDHRDHGALIAVDPVSREAVGVARYVRANDRSAAEAAVAVVDD
jgi:hypothetical protein